MATSDVYDSAFKKNKWKPGEDPSDLQRPGLSGGINCDDRNGLIKPNRR
jgi:hypothetical protein